MINYTFSSNYFSKVHFLSIINQATTVNISNFTLSDNMCTSIISDEAV